MFFIATDVHQREFVNWLVVPWRKGVPLWRKRILYFADKLGPHKLLNRTRQKKKGCKLNSHGIIEAIKKCHNSKAPKFSISKNKLETVIISRNMIFLSKWDQ